MLQQEPHHRHHRIDHNLKYQVPFALRHRYQNDKLLRILTPQRQMNYPKFRHEPVYRHPYRRDPTHRCKHLLNFAMSQNMSKIACEIVDEN